MRSILLNTLGLALEVPYLRSLASSGSLDKKGLAHYHRASQCSLLVSVCTTNIRAVG